MVSQASWRAIVKAENGIEVRGLVREYKKGPRTVDGTDISGTLDTPNPPGTVSSGTFNTSEHLIILDQGQLVAQGTGTVGGLLDPNPMVFDIAADPIAATSSMTGMLDVSLVSFDHAIARYDAVLTLPVNFDERVYDESGLTVDVSGVGTLEAADRFRLS